MQLYFSAHDCCANWLPTACAAAPCGCLQLPIVLPASSFPVGIKRLVTGYDGIFAAILVNGRVMVWGSNAAGQACEYKSRVFTANAGRGATPTECQPIHHQLLDCSAGNALCLLGC
jgi:hypothetical protein